MAARDAEQDRRDIIKRHAGTPHSMTFNEVYPPLCAIAILVRVRRGG